MTRVLGMVMLMTLAVVLLAGCTSQGVTIYMYNGDVIVGELVSGDFETEKLVVRMPDRMERQIGFDEIKRIEMGQPRR
ncbi:MAG TPA: hypothetical protein PKM88_10820 [bacterium]|mgnify:CR=1 FL=1|nr:hypothetical protein [bacterium]